MVDKTTVNVEVKEGHNFKKALPSEDSFDNSTDQIEEEGDLRNV